MSEAAAILPARATFKRSRESALDILWLSFVLALGVVLGFVVFAPQCAHWFLIPLLLCGTLTTMDALEWLRGRLDLMDPIGLMGVVGFHFFFLAPLLHVAWDYWMNTAAPPSDWRDWLGAMAAINAISLIAYRVSSRAPSQDLGWKRRSSWKLSKSRFTLVAGLALVVSGLAQLGVYSHFGGLSGYIETYRAHPEAFRGWGWLFVISETFPLMALMAFLVYARRHGPVVWGNGRTIALLLAFFVTQLLFGGLRGSRSNTVWALFCALGMIHFWIRPIRRSLVYAGVIFLVVFLYAYGFYKDYHGAANLNQTLQTARKHDRSLAAAVLGDMGRADIQAFVLYRLLATDSDYELEWGRTYLGAPALLVPHSIWPDRPPTTVKAGTEIQHYTGSYRPDQFESSRVYGLSGEAMLNFGPLMVPVAFFILGTVVRRVRYFVATAPALDSRRLVSPLLVEICIWLLIGDSALIMFSIMKQALMPCLVVYVASRRVVAA